MQPPDDPDPSNQSAVQNTGIISCQLTEEELWHIFVAKSEDFNIRVTEKLFRRFVKHQSKKPFLKSFEMDACGIGPKASNVIVEIVYSRPSIRMMSLNGNTVGDDGAVCFADLLLQTDRIISFDLTSNSIGERGASAIFQAVAHNKSVYSLHIGSTSAVGRNFFGPEAICDLEMMLTHNQVLAELDLSMSEIHAEQVERFVTGLARNKSLQVLILANNSVQSRGAALILQSCVEGQLQELDLSGNHLKDDSGLSFARFLNRSRTIRVLNLSGNNLTVRFTSAIVDALGQSTTLEELDLSGNPLGGKGLSALGTALATNRHLRALSVRHCKIEPPGFREFCQDLERNTSLMKLDFGHNPLRDDGSARFAPVLVKHPALKDVDFELCEIGDGGGEALFPALAKSPSVGRFSVKNNLIRAGLTIQKAVADNPRLLTLNVEFNDIDFKVFTEIQRLVRVNRKAWRDGQKDRIEQAVISQAEAEIQLAEVRCAIRDERTTIAMLQKKLADTEDSKSTAEADKAAHIADLERQLEEVSDLVDEELSKQRDEALEFRGQIGHVESEYAAIANKNERELLNFQRESKALKVVETEIREVESRLTRGDLEWTNMLSDAKMKYRDVRDALVAAHQKVLEQIKEAKLAEEAAKAAEEAAARAAARKNKRRKGRKKPVVAQSEGEGGGGGGEGGEGGEGQQPGEENAEQPSGENVPENPTEEEKGKVEFPLLPIREPEPRVSAAEEDPPEAVAPAAVPLPIGTKAGKPPKIAKPKVAAPNSARRPKKT